MQPLSAPQEIPSASAGRRSVSAPALAAGLAAVALVAGAVTLWAQYGTAVFFETIAAGLRSCF
ncbi:hypothetical protein LQG66_27300 [Bradyrhizobium ontarionense]|uniref:Uncharacterized protein n=1 Tax=Bradyrhizobium ontarionense TaxID=2898149 RepID=A0ABY3R7Y6_9BRAD|nr:hypothetical protein [Bradyrhizobium sp. A19]UFZ02936.1 hypothetical protein LQG66_27300 [Bradyrhizobium sp. A19]